MLTPDRIKNKSFTTTGMGSYRADDVDLFLKEVYTSYDQMFRENREIIKKMSILANRVEEYKKDEESLSQALISAQKLADQIVAESKEKASQTIDAANLKADEIETQARENANKLITDAKAEADSKIFAANKQSDEILGGINRKLTQEKLVYDMLHKEVSEFKDKMIEMYKEHFNLLDRLPDIANGKINAHDPEAEKILADIKDGNFAEILSDESQEEIAEIENVPYDDEPEYAPVEDVSNETEDAVEEADEDDFFEPEPEAAAEEEVAEDVEKEEEPEEIDGFSLMDIELDDGEEAKEETDVDSIIAEINADADEDNAEEDELEDLSSDDDGFSLDASAFDDDDDFDDISSGDKEDEEPVTAEENDDGFSIDFSNLELDDDDEEDAVDTKRNEYASVDAPESKSSGYSSADEDDDEEDDDEGAISFRRFFRKK